LILYPALVQGDGAAESIVKGIQALEQQNVDVLIVGRGGGSIEDLWAFNEEIVAHAIFNCSVPVISAVGHETDWTIADFVSDLRAPTPSAAAELAVFDYALTKQKLIDKKNYLDRCLKRGISMTRERLMHKQTKLRLVSPQNRLNENRRRLMDAEVKMAERIKRILTEKRHRLVVLAKTLDGYSPAKKISSGYAYVENQDHQSIRSVTMIKPKDEITIHVTDGNVKAIVTEVSKNE
jgi:exodeoxyribonuclease VII large subunit